jgi:DNA-binding MarR family transcriptional regulator
MGKNTSNGLLKTLIVVFMVFSLIFIICDTVSAEDYILAGTVTDSNSGDPIENATVLVTHVQFEYMVKTTTDSTGYFEITNLSSGTHTVEITAGGYFNETETVEVGSPTFNNNKTTYIPVQMDRTLTTEPVPSESKESEFPLFYLLLVIIVIAAIISLVMYSKIKRENLLKNAVRKRIFEHVKENPGIHYRAILNVLDLPMGVLSYHLNRLEKAQYIKSRQDGMFRRFYIRGPKTEMRFFLSDIQESILGVIKENHGISQSKIAEKINVSRKVVNYHINILDQAGLILVETRGRESACYPVETEDT